MGLSITRDPELEARVEEVDRQLALQYEAELKKASENNGVGAGDINLKKGDITDQLIATFTPKNIDNQSSDAIVSSRQLSRTQNFIEGTKAVATVVPKVLGGAVELTNMVVNPLIGVGPGLWQIVKDGEWDKEKAVQILSHSMAKEYFAESGVDERLTPAFLDPLVDGSAADIASDLTAFFAGYGFIKSGIKAIAVDPKGVFGALKKVRTGKVSFSDKAKIIGAEIGKDILIGGTTDYAMFDPEDGTAVDELIKAVPFLEDSILNYLVTDEDDTDAEIKFKQFLEGAGLGVAADLVVTGLRAWGGYNRKLVQKLKDEKTQQRTMVIEQHRLGNIDDDDLIISGYALTPEELVQKKSYDDNLGRDDAGNVKYEDSVILDAKKLKDKLEEIATPASKKGKKQTGGTKKIEIDGDMANEIDLPINTKNFTSSFGVQKVIDDVVSLMDDSYKIKWKKEQSNVATKKLAQMLDVKEDILEKGLINGTVGKDGKIKYDISTLPQRVVATKQVLQGLAAGAKKIAAKIANGTGTLEDEATFLKLIALIASTTDELKTAITAAARTTQAGRIKTGAKKLDVEAISSLAKNIQTGVSKGNIQNFAKRINNLEAYEDMVGVINRSLGARIWDASTELYINGLLAGPVTQLINLVSSGLELIYKPAELITGGLVTAPFSKTGRTAVIEGVARYKGMIKNVDDVLAATYQAFKNGDLVGDKMGRVIDTTNNPRSLSSKNFNVNYDGGAFAFESFIAGTLDLFGGSIRMPSRLLTTGDELIKQMSYRGELHALAYKKGLEANLEGKELVAFIADYEKKGFDSLGRFTNKEAKQYSRSTTFTDDLATGADYDLGGYVQSGVQRFPFFRILTPFVRTPTNLWRHQIQRLPAVGIFHKQSKDLWRAGGTARSELLGRQILATYLMFKAYDLATNGNITGGGPKDPVQFAAWSLTHQPYSNRIESKDGKTVTWKTYNRMDPRTFMLGQVADLVYLEKHAVDQDLQDLTIGILLSTISNLSSKMYLKGIVDMTSAIASESESRLQRVIDTTVSNYLPFSGLLRQSRKWSEGNNAMAREIRDLGDSLNNLYFWKASTSAPRRNIIGEIIYTGETSLIPRAPGDDNILFPWISGWKGGIKNLKVDFTKGFLPLLDVSIGNVKVMPYDKLHQELAKIGSTVKEGDGKGLIRQNRYLPNKLKGKTIDLADKKYMFPEDTPLYANLVPLDAMYQLMETYKMPKTSVYLGRTLRQSLEAQIESREYKSAAKQSTDVYELRAKLLRGTFNAYKTAVREEIIALNTGLKADIEESKENKGRGQQEAIAAFYGGGGGGDTKAEVNQSAAEAYFKDRNRSATLNDLDNLDKLRNY